MDAALGLLGLVAFLSLPVGALAAVVLLAKIIVRQLDGPQPSVDGTPPQRFTSGDRLALALILFGLLSLVGILVIGSGLAVGP